MPATTSYAVFTLAAAVSQLSVFWLLLVQGDPTRWSVTSDLPPWAIWTLRGALVAQLIVTILLCVLVWRKRKRIFGKEIAVSVGAFEGLVGRLDTFEQLEQRRAAMDLDFRRNVLDANEAQLAATKKQNALLTKVLGAQNHVGERVDRLKSQIAEHLKTDANEDDEAPE